MSTSQRVRFRVWLLGPLLIYGGSAAAADAPNTLPQDTFYSSVRQSLKQDTDRDVVRGHFDVGAAPNSRRYYCLVDSKSGEQLPNGVLGEPVPRKDGMTAVKKGAAVSQYRCADAEQKGMLVSNGYVLSGPAATANSTPPPPAAAAPAAVTPMPVPAPMPAAAAVPPPPAPVMAAPAAPANDRAADDRRAVAALDSDYQKAVRDNDSRTMARILADDFVLVDGNGKRWTKADLLSDAESGRTHYQHQDDSERTVRLWGDTAVVTAKLWAQGVEDGVPVDYLLWFSDTYVRSAGSWRYVFGQASLPLPKTPHK